MKTDRQSTLAPPPPLLHFNVAIGNQPETESIHTVTLRAQIQVQSPKRGYKAIETV
jgi:hypothetical protein